MSRDSLQLRSSHDSKCPAPRSNVYQNVRCIKNESGPGRTKNGLSGPRGPKNVYYPVLAGPKNVYDQKMLINQSKRKLGGP
ncbi:hypothetical protein C0J52_20321 [Blattella germanica]|nr:hypothetical protein C0J52_20321 [Blattella germanica]